MKLFDSLTHVTRDGSWIGERTFDASLRRLIADLDEAGAHRALLVAIAEYVDNDVIIESARAHPARLVPIAGLNPHVLSTTRRVQAVVKQIKAQGFAGIKLHPRMNGYDPLEDKCIAAIEAAGDEGLVVLLDTLFRRKGLATRHAPDIIDHLAAACPDTRILLLHGTGPTMMELYEIVRCNDNLMLDLSFTIMRYRGSSRLDADMNYLFKSTDQLITIGSDFPEYTPKQVLQRFEELAVGVEPQRKENIAWRNLERWFPAPAVPG
jgi:predicted TIM-barrel fold metal-dependent hydrolase